MTKGDKKEFDDVLRKMLSTPPKPREKKKESKPKKKTP